MSGFNLGNFLFNSNGFTIGASANSPDLMKPVENVVNNSTPGKIINASKGFFNKSATDYALIALSVLLLFGVLISNNKETVINLAKTAV